MRKLILSVFLGRILVRAGWHRCRRAPLEDGGRSRQAGCNRIQRELGRSGLRASREAGSPTQ